MKRTKKLPPLPMAHDPGRRLVDGTPVRHAGGGLGAVIGAELNYNGSAWLYRVTASETRGTWTAGVRYLVPASTVVQA